MQLNDHTACSVDLFRPSLAPDDPAAKPDLSTLRAFAVPGGVILKLHRSTWHAGPYFERDSASFFNLELSDTNEVDHHRCDLAGSFQRRFRIVPPVT